MTSTPSPSNTVLKIDGRIAATLVVPGPDGPYPGVLLLHGFASSRDEVGGAFVRLAAALAGSGIASLRIDFAGWGESDGDMADTTVGGQVADALRAADFLRGYSAVDSDRLGLLGFSLGGGVAAAVAEKAEGVFRSLVLWGSVGSVSADMGQALGEAAHQEATASGVATIDLGWRTVRLGRSFFDSLGDVDVLEALAAFRGAFLAVAGSEDRLAGYLDQFLVASAGREKAARRVTAADHIFHALDPSRSRLDEVVAMTTTWFDRTLRRDESSAAMA